MIYIYNIYKAHSQTHTHNIEYKNTNYYKYHHDGGARSHHERCVPGWLLHYIYYSVVPLSRKIRQSVGIS